MNHSLLPPATVPTLQVEDLLDRSDTAAITDSADWIVIGTGASGAAAARVLTEAGEDVILVEEGRPMPPGERPADSWSSFKHAWRDAGMQVAQGRSFLPILQGCAVGGSTVIYGAIVHRMPESIFASWQKDWGWDRVISWDDLHRVYDRLDAELSVAPAPTAVLGGNNLLMQKGVEAMGVRGNVIRRNVVGCDGSVRCLQGCPRGRKQSMDQTFLPRAMQAGARLYATCRAESLILEGERARGVRCTFRDPRTGAHARPATFHARKGVFLAASAIQSPLFLLDNGLGRRAPTLGRRLQAHPGSAVIGVYDDPVRIWYGATQGYETTHWWDEKMKFETVGAPLEVGAARLPGFGTPWLERVRDFGHIAHWGVQIRAEAHGRVRRGLFGSKVISYCITPQDVRVLKKGMVRLAEMHFAAGARTVLPGVHGLPDELHSVDEMKRIHDLPDDPRLFHGIASHLFGTAMLAPQAAGGVVGADFQTYGLRDLYVVDSSIFPTNFGVNPAHTISAIAWLAAESALEGRTAAT
jgi:choline dehydrogenase-like flavoprotein